MENHVHEGPLHQVELATVEVTAGIGNHLEETPSSPHRQGELDSVVPSSVRVLIRSLIERYQLTREQFVAIYDDYASCKLLAAAVASSQQQQQQLAAQARADAHRESQQVLASSKLAEANGAGKNPAGQGGEEGGGRARAPPPLTQEGDEPDEELHGEVGKMQHLVQSAIKSYETSSISELGQKRKMFSLEEELNLKPSPFAQELLE